MVDAGVPRRRNRPRQARRLGRYHAGQYSRTGRGRRSDASSGRPRVRGHADCNDECPLRRARRATHTACHVKVAGSDARTGQVCARGHAGGGTHAPCQSEKTILGRS
jgi:hypothetical protein